MSEPWTEEELARLPQTTAVFDQPKLVMSEHEWLQQGYFILDNCPRKGPACHQGGIPIPSGKTLIKHGGRYDLADEL